jgi:hypothetical protein
MKKKFIEVQFYGDKGVYDGNIGYFKSAEAVQEAWERFLANTKGPFGQMKDDKGQVMKGILKTGYKILTRNAK